MKIVVGVSPEDSGSDAVALGAVLARLLDATIVLTYVHPPTIDFPSMGHVDAEWATFLQERGDATLDRAESQLAVDGGIVDVERVTVSHPSVSRGLRQTADDLEAQVTVIGPGSVARDGHLSLGSIAHSLLHGGSTAVALAPEGYRETAPEEITRLVVGFQDTPEACEVVRVAAEIARPRSLPVQLLTVVLRTTRISGSRLGRDPERAVMETLMVHEAGAQERCNVALGETFDGEVVQGDTADQAMARFDWKDGDVFIVASSRLGPLRRVFLGDTTHKLLRALTVPVVVMPRHLDDLP